MKFRNWSIITKRWTRRLNNFPRLLTILNIVTTNIYHPGTGGRAIDKNIRQAGVGALTDTEKSEARKSPIGLDHQTQREGVDKLKRNRFLETKSLDEGPAGAQ